MDYKARDISMKKMNPSLINIISEALESNGFQRKGKVNLFRFRGDILQIVNLQPSSYEKGYYINLGVVFNKSPGDQFPKVEEFDIMARLSRLLNWDSANQTLPAEILDEAEAVRLTKLVRQEVERFFHYSDNRARLTSALKENVFEGKALVKLSLRKALLVD